MFFVPKIQTRQNLSAKHTVLWDALTNDSIKRVNVLFNCLIGRSTLFSCLASRCVKHESPVYLFQSARIMASRQNYSGAAAHLEKLLQQQPDNMQAVNLLMEVYSRQGRWDQAAALTERLSQNEQTRALADLMKAGLFLRQGKNEEAIQNAEDALEQNGQLIQAVPIVADAMVAMGDVEELPGAFPVPGLVCHVQIGDVLC